MNRDNSQSIAVRARDTVRNLGRRGTAAVAGLGAMLASTAAAASGSSAGSTAAAAINGAKPDVELVQTAMLGILIVLVVFALIKKSLSK